MVGITLPEAIILDYQFPNAGWQCMEQIPRSGGLPAILSSRRPLTKWPRSQFAFGLIEKEVQFTAGRIPIHLFIPA